MFGGDVSKALSKIYIGKHKADVVSQFWMKNSLSREGVATCKQKRLIPHGTHHGSQMISWREDWITNNTIKNFHLRGRLGSLRFNMPDNECNASFNRGRLRKSENMFSPDLSFSAWVSRSFLWFSPLLVWALAFFGTFSWCPPDCTHPLHPLVSFFGWTPSIVTSNYYHHCSHRCVFKIQILWKPAFLLL